MEVGEGTWRWEREHGGRRGNMEVGKGTWRWEREHGGGRGNMEVGEGTWRTHEVMLLYLQYESQSRREKGHKHNIIGDDR